MFKLNTFYQSKEWINFREIIISKRIKENPRSEIICEHCNKPIYAKFDCIAHHKEELTPVNVNDLNISLNENNIALVHHKCHDEIHSRFGSEKREVYVVWGSPCAGKRDYVMSLVGRNDIVIDMDLIYNMINPYNGMYNKPNRLYLVAKTIYDKLLEDVFNRTGQWHKAYIITCECLETQLNRMAEKYGARLIHIDTDKEECILNLLKDELKYNYTHDWMKYINEYWSKYNPPTTRL